MPGNKISRRRWGNTFTNSDLQIKSGRWSSLKLKTQLSTKNEDATYESRTSFPRIILSTTIKMQVVL